METADKNNQLTGAAIAVVAPVNNSVPTIINGRTEWQDVDGRLHREDGGPAVISPNDTQHWYVNGKRHRLDGPAVIWADGTQEWWVNGKLHRLDGPATIHADGTQEWWINGLYVTVKVKNWMKKNNITYPFDKESATLFKLIFG